MGAIIAAIAEGTKAAAINATFQYIGAGFDVNKINWNAVGSTFVSAGVSKGLGMGGGIVKPGGSDIFSYALAGGIKNGITNVAVNAALDKGGDVWGQFQDGFKVGALSRMGKWGFKQLVTYDPSIKSGNGVAGKNNIPTKGELGLDSVESLNNVGIGIGGDAPSFMKGWFMEGQLVSEILNFSPA